MADTAARLATALAGRYRVERELGAGGMATVFLAEDLKHGRKVALKVLREDLAASVGAARFLREIAIAAQLQHPNILSLLDSGEADGLLYYVMPYVEGPSLRSRLASSGELPVAEAVRLLMEVTEALAYAHERGVIHRDIKPDNVMLSGRHALITDFGVARAVSTAGAGHTMTSLGVALGTPAYMAPEQATADPNVDHRADIYSLGILAYELLTGRPPFTATTPQQVLAQQVTETPDPVSRHRTTISPELENVVMQGVTVDDLIDFTPELRAEATKMLKQYSYGPLFTPPSGRPTILLPGIGGGASWAGAAVDPGRGVMYVPSVTAPVSVRIVSAQTADGYHKRRGEPGGVPGPRGLPMFKPPYGRITAIDLNTGEHLWVSPVGEGPRQHEAIRHLNLPPLGWPRRTQVLLTPTLLFAAQQGTRTGEPRPGSPRGNADETTLRNADPALLAFDPRDGRQLAKVRIPGNATGAFITYVHEGVQYIVLPIGGASLPAEMVALRLPSKRR